MAKKQYEVISPVRVNGKVTRSGTITLDDKDVKGLEHCLKAVDSKSQAEAEKAAQEAQAKEDAEAEAKLKEAAEKENAQTTSK